MNDSLRLQDPVGEEHRPLTEGVHRLRIELLAKGVLNRDRLAERLQRCGEISPAGVRK